MKNILVTAIGCIFLFAACKKEEPVKKTTCSSNLVGYKHGWQSTVATMLGSPGSFGIINTSTSALSVTASVFATVYSNQGAYNSTDHCYYVFSHGEGSIRLNKIEPSGIVTTYTNSTGTAIRYDGLVHNPVTNKMYGVKITSTASTVVELAISGTTFSETAVATTSGLHRSVSPVTSSVDATTGDVYFEFSSFSPSIFSIHKYHPGSASAVVIATGTDAQILGLRFNKNDNMLYAISEGVASGDFKFIKIHPATGAVTTLSTLPFEVNNEFYTSALDACSDHYVVSSMLASGGGWDTGRCTFSVLNMAGSMIQHDTVTGGIYQGFQVAY